MIVGLFGVESNLQIILCFLSPDDEQSLFEASIPHRLFSEPRLPQKRLWLYQEVYFYLSFIFTIHPCKASTITNRFFFGKLAIYKRTPVPRWKKCTSNLWSGINIMQNTVMFWCALSMYLSIVDDSNWLWGFYSRKQTALAFLKSM